MLRSQRPIFGKMDLRTHTGGGGWKTRIPELLKERCVPEKVQPSDGGLRGVHRKGRKETPRPDRFFLFSAAHNAPGKCDRMVELGPRRWRTPRPRDTNFCGNLLTAQGSQRAAFSSVVGFEPRWMCVERLLELFF